MVFAPGRDHPLVDGVHALEAGGGLFPDGPHGPRHADALVIGDAAPNDLHATLTSEADAAGLPVIHHRGSAATSSATRASRCIEVGAGAPGGPFPRAMVDARQVTPIGFRWGADGPPVVSALTPGAHWQRGFLAVLAALGEDRDVAIAVPRDGAGHAAEPPTGPADPSAQATPLVLPDDPADRIQMLRRSRGVLDHPDLHRDPAQRATWLAMLACAGIPVVPLDLVRAPSSSGEVAVTGLGPRLTAALREAVPDDLTDPARRERCSVRQRRAAQAEHAGETAWRAIAAALDLVATSPPSVSVLLASNRPGAVLAAAARAAAFRYPHRELIVALHGEGFPAGIERRLRAIAGDETTVLHVPARRRLGEVLALATEAASGELIAKLDDDDRYDVHHLDDLVQALRYSGATVAGKGSEFVHLGEIDLTIRRLPKGAESSSRTVAGGTLLLGRDVLREVGGWQHAARSVDQLLLDDVLAAGGRLHRTHGHGFVLDRHGRGHTWPTSTDYFLRQAVAQWPGLALDAAGFTAPDAGAELDPAAGADAG